MNERITKKKITKSKSTKALKKKSSKKVASKKVVKKSKTRKKPRPGLINEINKPIIPSPNTLPLLDPNFGWDRFEKFTRDLISKIHKDYEAKIMGRRGDKQYGIDLIIDDVSGLKFVAQCKCYQSYTVSDFKKAKNDLEIGTDRCILLLACEASAELRKEVLNDSKWEIWDVVDITSKVMALDRGTKKELIKNHFGPDWARALVEYNEHSCLVSSFEFFKPFLNRDNIFNHTVPYIGRENELTSISNFLLSKEKVLIINSPGGIGKSRLLLEGIKSNNGSGWDFLFIKESQKPTASDFQGINSEKVVFVFDDAHRLDIAPFLEFIRSLKIEFKIILSTRPQGKESLKLRLRPLNIESKHIQNLELNYFKIEETKKIVNSLLPQLGYDHSYALARIMAESTLIGVLTCNLLKDKTISLSALSSDNDIKETVMSRFIDELSGNVRSEVNSENVKKVLNMVSAFAPLSYRDGRVTPFISNVLGFSESEVNRAINDLVYSGVLIDRGEQIRIAPDVLSDCVLERECFYNTGKPSMFFEEMSREAKDNKELLVNLIRNVSELDWRSREGNLSNSILLKPFWSSLDISGAEGLYSINEKLELVKSIAFYQPVESYEVLMKAFDVINGFERDEWQISTAIGSMTGIAREIIVAGYNRDRVMLLLWELGRTDERDLNSMSGHPVRKIQDLCSYSKNLPVALYEDTFLGLKKIIASYNPDTDRQNPIKLLEGFLAKTAHSTFSEGHSLSFKPFHISYENTKELRDSVIELLEELALNGTDVRKAYSAIEVLEGAMSPPRSMMGLGVHESNINIWAKEIVMIANTLVKVFKKTKFSLIRLEVRKIFSFERKWNHYPEETEFIEEFLEDNPISDNELMYPPFAYWNYNEVFIDHDHEDYTKMEKQNVEALEKAIEGLNIESMTSEKIYEFAEEIIGELQSVGLNANSHPFSNQISNSPELDNQEMCRTLLAKKSRYLGYDFYLYLKKVAENNLKEAIELTRLAIDDNCIEILTSISQHFWWVFEGHSDNKKLKDLFAKLYNSENENVKNCSVWTIKRLAKVNSIYAKEIALDFTVESTRQGKEFTSLIDETYGIDPKKITGSELVRMLDKIKNIDKLQDHSTQSFINVCAKRIPLELFEFLVYRVNSKSNQSSDFRALPYDGFRRKLVLNVDESMMLELFERIADGYKAGEGSIYALPELFFDLTKHNQEIGLSYVDSLLKSSDLENVRVGVAFLRKFSGKFVFSKQEWVRELLSHGKRMGKEHFDRISDGLYVFAIPTSKQGTVGEPMPQDVALVNDSLNAIENSEYDYEKDFYNQLKQHGEKCIERTMCENERLLNSRY